MAASTVTYVSIPLNSGTTMPTGVTVAAGDGALVTIDKPDQNILLMLKNANTSVTQTAVIKAGNGLQGVADLEITLAASATKGVVVESGKFKNMSGTNKGKLNVRDKNTTGTNIEVSAVVLPVID